MNAGLDLLDWPKVSTIDVWILSFFLIVIFFIILLLLFYQKRTIARNQMWYMLRNHIQKKGLSIQETNILKQFFFSLPRDEVELLFLNSKTFYRKLYHWFSLIKDVDANLEVRILDKLFANLFGTGPVSSVSNLKAGEACSIELEDGSHHLSKIISVKKGEFNLSVPDLSHGKSKGFKSGSELLLYIFRPNHGVYRFHGQIVYMWKDGIRCVFDGKLIHKGIHHYMTVLELDCKMTPWPPLESNNDESIKNGELEQAEGTQKKEKPIVVHGQTSRISDRAFIFFVNKDTSVELPLNDIWEMELKLPDGYILKCKGKIIQIQSARYKYLFKYVDINDNSRKILFSLIKENIPVREKLL